MPDELGAILIAEIGSVTTRVLLVDEVEGESRLIFQIEQPTTIEPPANDVRFAIFAACEQIEKLLKRKLLDEQGNLLMPQNKEKEGVNHIVALSSAAGNLGVIITAIASDISARSSVRACCSTYTSILQVITLDDFERFNASEQTSAPSTATAPKAKKSKEVRAKGKASKEKASKEKPSKDKLALANRSWIERQVQSMLALHPDVVMIAGGLEGGAVDTLKRLAHIVALTTLRTAVDSSGQQRQDTTNHPVIYAGNTAAREHVYEVLQGHAEVMMVDNVRPSIEQENLDPTQIEIDRLYHKLVLSNLPGLGALQSLSRVPITTVCNAVNLMTRFMAQRYHRQVLTIDVGSASSSAFYASGEQHNSIVLGTCGSGYGVTTVMKERGLDNLSRWLPFEMSNRDLTHWLLNKVMRPQLVPASLEELLLEHAVVREALTLLMEAICGQNPKMNYDMVVACGGVLGHAPAGLAALTILDALQPTAQESMLALDIYLDTLGLIAACGGVAKLEPDVAATLFERDVLQNAPLATCVIPLGDGRAGKVALKAELIPLGGQSQEVSVRHGEIVRLPLEPGYKAQLKLKPSSGVRIGGNAPGVEVVSDAASINGSHLGIIIDARGRPLSLLKDAKKRNAQIWEWLTALGVVKGMSPYLDTEPVVVGQEDTSPEEEVVLLEELEPQPIEEPAAAQSAEAGAAEAGAAEIAVGEEVATGDEQPAKPKSKKELAKEARQRAKEEKARAREEKKQSQAAKKTAKKDGKGKSKGKGKGKAEPETGGEQEGELKPGSRISLTDMDISPPPANSGDGDVENDLASLRNTVEDPKAAKKKGKGKAKKGGKKKLF